MAQLTKQRVRRWWIVPFLIGAVVVLIGARLRGWPPPITGRDLNQHRANAPAAIPNGDLTIAQTFVPSRDGLSEIELIVYQVGEAGSGELTLDLRDATGNLVGSQVLGSAELTLNQTVNFQFAIQENSADAPYTLQISGRDNTNTTFWGFDLESISSGELTASDPTFATTAQDLRMLTHYQLTPQLLLRRAGMLFLQSLPLVMLTLWVVGVMGWLTVRGLGKRLLTGDLPTDLATVFAVGLAIWPLQWLWLTTLGGHWGRISLAIWLLSATLVVSVQGWRSNKKDQPTHENHVAQNHAAERATPASGYRYKIAWQHVVLAILLLVGYVLRLLAIRDLAFPAWVDASRHGLMTAVMRDSGQFLQTYGDYLPIDHAPLYHFGYHTLTATLALLTDAALPTLLLTTGQLLNAVVPLATYATAYLLTRERTVGLSAAFMIAFPSFFPAYYVSWGRYTQLTGMIVLALLIGWSYRLSVRAANRPFNPYALSERIGQTLLVGSLAAGLFLIHFRLFLIFVPFGLIVWLFYWRRDSWWPLPLAGFVTFGLVLPRFLQMVQYVSPERVSGSSDGYNNFPISYVKIGWERWFLIAALLIGIMAALQLCKHVRWRYGLLIVGMLVIVLVGEWLGSIPAAFGLTYLRTGVVGLLVLLSQWRSAEKWVAFPVAWVIAEPFFNTQNEKLILAGLLLATVWIAQRSTTNAAARIALLLAAWVGVLFVLLSGQRLGLPESWVLNMNSTYITLFLPLAVVLGYGLFALGERAVVAHWLVQLGVYAAMGGTLLLLTLYGGRQQIEILNQGTVLAEPPDVAGIAWVSANIPPDAKIAISSWKWLGASWAAQDGGAWLLPLTQRAVTTPPADYIYEPTLEAEVRAFNEAAQDVADWSADSALDLLRQYQVTHIYVGARGGFLLPDKLIQNEAVQLRYARDGVFIFELLQGFD